MGKVLFGLILSVSLCSTSQARMHEVELHSTQALLQVSDEAVVNLEANYLLELAPSWQVLFGAAYDRANSDTYNAGLTVGAVYNFGATEHNNKYYLKPQLNVAFFKYGYDYYDSLGFHYSGSDSDTTVFMSLVFGKRFPIFEGESYTVNYTPSIGVSVPVNNTDLYDPVFSLSVVGLSLVF